MPEDGGAKQIYMLNGMIVLFNYTLAKNFSGKFSCHEMSVQSFCMKQGIF
jgi:hypothetical protein